MVGSTKSEYALRALVRLARAEAGTLTVREIAQAEEISLKYLERVMALLKRAGYVCSTLGAKGGYHLAKPPDQIICGEIIRLFDQRSARSVVAAGNGFDAPDLTDNNSVRHLWQRTRMAVGKVLDQTTIADLLPASSTDKTSDAIRAYLAECEVGYMFYI